MPVPDGAGRLFRLARAGTAAGLAVLLGAAAVSDERMVRNFDLIVFRSEYREGVEEYLRKWVAPIRVHLDLRAGDSELHRRLVERHVAHLTKVTGHDIRIVDDADKANLMVLFERESRLDRAAAGYFDTAGEVKAIMAASICFGRYWSNSRFEIFKAVVVIPTDRAGSRGKLPACVVEEITQVLGLPNDSAEVYPSIFNDHSVDEELTATDETLLRILYDGRLRPGMPRTEVLDAVRGILPELRR